jgi:hypothetical protein
MNENPKAIVVLVMATLFKCVRLATARVATPEVCLEDANGLIKAVEAEHGSLFKAQ